jgi:hypothetical protein
MPPSRTVGYAVLNSRRRGIQFMNTFKKQLLPTYERLFDVRDREVGTRS